MLIYLRPAPSTRPSQGAPSRTNRCSWCRRPAAARFKGLAERRPTMKPRITVLTLGVDDLERALHFYRDGLGLPSQGIVGEHFEHGAVAFFDLQDGLKLAAWPRTSLAHDCGLAASAPSATELSIGHNV